MRRIRACHAGCAGVVLLLGTLMLGGCGHPSAPAESATAKPAQPRQVQVIEVAQQTWPHSVRAQGSLMEDEYAVLGTKVAGRVKEVLVDLGTPVTEGQVLATLDSEEFELRVQQAEAQVAQARATLGLKLGVPDAQLDPTKAAPVLQEKAVLEEARMGLERIRSLTGRGVVTQEELQQRESALGVAQARYDSALNSVQEHIAMLAIRRAELSLAKQIVTDSVLKAPFAGMIQERHVAPGSYVNVGSPVVTLVRIDPLRFRAGIPERSAMGIEVGQPVRIRIEGQPTPVETQISRISPALDLSSRALVIEADVQNQPGSLRSGLFAEAEIVVDPEAQALAVPLSSVVAFGGVEKVWTVKGETAQAQRIRTGRREGELVEVLDGLQAGDMILSDGRQGYEGVVHVSRQTPGQSGATPVGQ